MSRMYSRRDTSTSEMTDRSITTRKRRPTESTINSGFTMDQSSEDWEEGAQAAGSGVKRRKKDEPTSPIVVVIYVTIFYLIFQLLTRSDDMEILSHLPETSSLRSALPFSLGGSNLHSDLPSHNPYALPYHLPHIPSPIPKVENGSTSIWRVILGVLVYPLYLIITLIAVPMPLLLNILHFVVSILGTALYPLTSTIRLIVRTFVIGPLGIFQSIFETLYPVLAFVGGVVGLGCAMGFGAGWIGKLGLDWMLGRGHEASKRGVSSASTRKAKSERSAKSRPSRISTKRRDTEEKNRDEGRRSDSGSGNELIMTPTARRKTFPREIGANDDKASRANGKKGASHEEPVDFDVEYRGHVYATAREPQVVGTRRRKHGFDGR